MDVVVAPRHALEVRVRPDLQLHSCFLTPRISPDKCVNGECQAHDGDEQKYPRELTYAHETGGSLLDLALFGIGQVREATFPHAGDD